MEENSVNSVQLIGNISTDIDLRATPAGKFVAKFNIAVNNPYNREKTSFLAIEVWGKNAENTSEYCSKGSKVGIVGHIEVDQWDRDGERKYKTKVVASSVEFLTQKNQSNTNTSNNNSTSNTGNYAKIDDDPFSSNGKTIDISDDDLPF